MLSSYGDIADGAEVIYNDCHNDWGVKGQVFSNEGWNVVRWDNHDC